MALGTIIGKYTSTEVVADQFFGAWWFTLLWAVGVALGTAYFIRQRVRRPLLVLLHLSFVVILLGALLTHLTAHKGMIHLREGKPATTYTTKAGEQRPLPFTLTLRQFRVSYHAGNMAAMVARCRLLWHNSWRKRPCLSTNMPTSPMKSNA